MILERKRRCLSENDPNKKSEDYNQIEAPINEMSTVNSINESMSEVQGPTDDNNKKQVAKSMDNGDADERRQYLSKYDE